MNVESEGAFLRRKRGGYFIGLAPRLADVDSDQILQLLRIPARANVQTLGGRGVFSEAKLPGIGKVFIKQYTRGGVYRWLVSKNYLRWGQTRGERECTYLAKVRSIGVAAPEPLGFVYRGNPFCRAWLITSYIENAVNLAQLCLTDEDRTTRALSDLVRQIILLIRNSIQHVDLHPGNVLVGAGDNACILDFDKAHEFKGPASKLRDYYLRRWRRAVLKHRLPDYLSEIVSLGLRQYGRDERSNYL